MKCRFCGGPTVRVENNNLAVMYIHRICQDCGQAYFESESFRHWGEVEFCGSPQEHIKHYQKAKSHGV